MGKNVPLIPNCFLQCILLIALFSYQVWVQERYKTYVYIWYEMFQFQVFVLQTKKKCFRERKKLRGLLTCEVLQERGIEYVYLSVLTNSVDHALYVLLRVPVQVNNYLKEMTINSDSELTCWKQISQVPIMVLTVPAKGVPYFETV